MRKCLLVFFAAFVLSAALAYVLMTYAGSSFRPDSDVTAADNEFGFELFGRLAEKRPGRNIFISPVSVAVALQMTFNGAGGRTREAMAEVLRLDDMDLERLNNGAAGLIQALEKADPLVELTVANSIWANDPVRDDFAKRMRRFYRAEFGPLDVTKINNWVRKATKGKIPKILEKTDPGEFLVLTNAVYFKGIWTVKFDKQLTADGEFTLRDGSKKTVPMMHQKGEYEYLDGDGFEALRLPYGEGRLAMYVFVPDADSSLEKFIGGLTFEKWQSWMGEFRKAQLHVGMPRLRVEYDADLKETLKAMGMEIAFTPEADFGAMAGGWISRVLHKTFVEVNEEGTEAAAATAVIMQKAIASDRTVLVNRPFFCVIRDDHTGAILFMGAIEDPTRS